MLKVSVGDDEDPREREYREIVETLPTQSEIFLPTDKFSLDERLAGIKIVRDIYDRRLEAIYRPRLRALREKYKRHKRCFIIGNGPSLNVTDLAVLKDEVTIAVNGFFLKSQELGLCPTFYVVEDHLVAEDRRTWINAFKGPTKLFPVYLGYGLDEGDDTIFFNHRPRRSYPHGFDFSTNAAEVTYTGCTVTYTCMQLAYYLGFKEIYLIGVDANYDLPKDVKRSGTYGVGVLDMKSDDPNHFHPDYFGKGFRWHDPQVDKMIEAYEEARRVLEPTSQRIYNATVGGKLEVFERRAFSSLFRSARKPEELAKEQSAGSESAPAQRSDVHSAQSAPDDLPRLLVFDITARGDGSATGELKRNIFAEWPENRYLQIFLKSGRHLGVQRGSRVDAKSYACPDECRELLGLIESYRPELIIYRPVPDAQDLHTLAVHSIAARPDARLVTWIVDDWPSRLQADDAQQFVGLNDDWLWLLRRSTQRLSIGERMSSVFKERYGYDFEPVANGVDPADWPEPVHGPRSELVIRYAGALADNMTARSVRRVAEAVEELADEGNPVRFEIRTRELWKNLQHEHFSKLKHTSFITDSLSPQQYRSWLSAAGAVVIAYNFDADSLRYIGLSLANKLPECLASGAPLIAHGPQAAATIAYVAYLNCATVIDVPEQEKVKAEISALLKEDRRKELSARAREVAFSRHDLRTIRTAFMTRMAEAARSPIENPPKRCSRAMEFPRSLHMSVDETGVVASILHSKIGSSCVMVDVGAHFGNSASHFVPLGWKIYCFEPDPNNREKLVKRFGTSPNVFIDPRAVGDKPVSCQPFYASQESTGIASLYAFHETHRRTALVDVTTVSEVVREHGLTHIDFLKVDVEGLDFAVLKGVPWDTIMPDVIECEFEDAKTLPLGHSYKDIAEDLIDKGYTVYVSEWHPIVRYGIGHDWCRLLKYPAELRTPQAWGNLLAFRQDPGIEAVRTAFADRVGFNKHAICAGKESDSATTLVILGNGPSLKGFGFERLKKFDCVGMNAAYRYWREIGWYPRFYACLDLVVGLSHRDAIADLIRDSDQNGIELFFLRRNLIEVLPAELRSSRRVVDFDAFNKQRLHAPQPITTGSHAALIGAYLGYRRLVLLGVDCNYVEDIDCAKNVDAKVLEVVKTPEHNPNYFFAGYQAVGDRYNVPNPTPDLHLRSWRAVAPLLKREGVTVWNCSPISRVEVFHLRDFEDIEHDFVAREAGLRRLTIDYARLRLSKEQRPASTSASKRYPRFLIRAAEFIKTRSALLFALGQFGVWSVRTLWRRRWERGGLAVLAILAPLVLALAAPSPIYRWGLVALSILAALLLLVKLGNLFVQEKRGASDARR